MSDSFRRGVSFADFRKPDGIGLVELGRSVRVELLEVTTERNFASAVNQMRDKMGTLMKTVAGNMGSPFPMEVVGTPWRPGPNQQRCPAVPDAANKEIARWICFLPSLRNQMPAGVTLYEVHAVRLNFDEVPVTKLSKESEQAAQKAFMRARAKPAAANEIGEQLPVAEPALRVELAQAAAILGMVAVVGLLATACVGAVAEPVPGDEVIACGLAVKAVERAVQMAPAL